MIAVPSIGVVGAGTLGSTVVRAAVAAGCRTTVLVRGGPERSHLRAEELAGAVRREAARRALPMADVERRLALLRVTHRVEDLAEVEVVVESVPEDPDLKRRVLRAVEDVVAADAVLASSTSSIPAGELAEGARHPERVVVAHFVWPAHRIPLVEVALHPGTAPWAEVALDRLLRVLGKRSVRVADRPGFLLTRALFAYWDAAIELVRDGTPPAAVDDALTSFGWPLGPFAVMEATGPASIAVIHGRLAPRLDVPFPSLAAFTTAVAAGADRIYGAGRTLAPALDRTLTPTAHALPMDADDVVAHTMGALAAEVEEAVLDGAIASWPQAAAAVDAAYGFPRERGGLAGWWDTEIRPRREAAGTSSLPVPRGPVLGERMGRAPL